MYDAKPRILRRGDYSLVRKRFCPYGFSALWFSQLRLQAARQRRILRSDSHFGIVLVVEDGNFATEVKPGDVTWPRPIRKFR